MACYLQLFVRDIDALTRCANEAETLAEDYGFALVDAVAMVGRGRALVAGGSHDAGIAIMRNGIDAYRARRQVVGLPPLLAAFADAQTEAGQLAEALVIVAEAQGLVESTGEVRLEPELQRMEGDLRQRQNDHDAAQRCFRSAIAIARRQGARWWELRASVSLARPAPATGQACRRAPRSRADRQLLH